MSELSFEQMLEESLKTIRNGEIVQGTVIDVKDDEIILNIGYKADGIITVRDRLYLPIRDWRQKRATNDWKRRMRTRRF